MVHNWHKKDIIKRKNIMQICLVYICFTFFSLLSRANDLPANLQVVLISKVLPYEISIKNKKKVSVFVLGSPSVYQAFHKFKQKGYGAVKIDELEIGPTLPESHFDVIYLADKSLIDKTIEYAANNKVLIVAPDIDWVEEGITLAMGVTDSRPKFYINLTTSVGSGLNWDNKILEIATIYR